MLVKSPVYKYAFKMTVKSTLNSSTVSVNRVVSTDNLSHRFESSPMNMDIPPRGTVSFIYLTDNPSVLYNPEKYIRITAQLCRY